MNTESTHDDRHEAFLAPFVAAARDNVPQTELAAAAERLRSRLPAVPRASRSRLLRYATAALVLTAVLFGGQQMLPGNGGSAFAQVQEWFENFRTMSVVTSIRSGDKEVVNVHVRARADGTVRIEQAGIVNILDPAADAMYTLMPGRRYFTQPLNGAAAEPGALEWFEDIRKFRGAATRIDETRVLDGERAEGFRLHIRDTDLTLWAAADSHRPLLLEGALPGGLDMTSTLHFDVTLDASLFRVPPDYEPVSGND